MSKVEQNKVKVIALSQLPENKICFECGSNAPQWASVTYGIFFCLECSGLHRSVTMDSWKDLELRKMLCGGNQKALEAFQNHPDYRQGMPVKEKYITAFAAEYKEKLASLAEERPFDPTRIVVPASSTQSTKSSIDNKEGPGFATNEGRKEVNEAYFARKGKENESRPEHLPPSQGGKYAGFGSQNSSSDMEHSNSANQNDIVQDLTHSFSRGWSMFATVAGAALTQAHQQANKVYNSVETKAKDPQLRQNVANYMSNVSKQVIDTRKKGIDAVNRFIHQDSAQHQPLQHPNQQEREDYHLYNEDERQKLQSQKDYHGDMDASPTSPSQKDDVNQTTFDPYHYHHSDLKASNNDTTSIKTNTSTHSSTQPSSTPSSSEQKPPSEKKTDQSLQNKDHKADDWQDNEGWSNNDW